MIADAIENLKKLVNDSELAADVTKADGGTAAAGTAVRVKMQAIKAAAQNIRQQILTERKKD